MPPVANRVGLVSSPLRLRLRALRASRPVLAASPPVRPRRRGLPKVKGNSARLYGLQGKPRLAGHPEAFRSSRRQGFPAALRGLDGTRARTWFYPLAAKEKIPLASCACRRRESRLREICSLFESVAGQNRAESRTASREKPLTYDRFTSGQTLYAYVGNNSINFNDPSGLKLAEAAMLAGEFGGVVKRSWKDTLESNDTAGQTAWKIIQGLPPAFSEIGMGAGAAFGSIRNLFRVESAVAKGLGNQNPLYKAAVQEFKNSELSNAGRALTKHPELIGETKETIRQSLRTDGAINEAAHSELRDIMRNGVTTNPTLGRYGTVTQIQVPGGFGARWASDGSFIGFINP